MKTLWRSQCAVLSLVLKRKWFDMIASGKKRQEYRAMTPYWKKRLVNWIDRQEICRHVPVIEFRNGYAADAPRMAFVSDGPQGRNGFVMAYCLGRVACRHDWGEPNGPHYVIPLGERVELLGETPKARKAREA